MDNLKAERVYGEAKLPLKTILRRIGTARHSLEWSGHDKMAKYLEEAELALLEFIKEQED